MDHFSPPYFLSPPPPPPPQQSNGFDLNNKVSPSMLLIIIILAIIFFISGLLHLLVRFLLRPPNRDPDDIDSVTALQGQLQQLFHLHDAGVDQSFIDALPVFNYKAIIGVKDPFDCAVCLCEFEGEDKLRLLPKCSHAFHMDCIDTWLLSHSTCPLCRASLLPEFSTSSNCSPIVLVLESGSVESSREMVLEREMTSSVARENSHLSTDVANLDLVGEIQLKEDESEKVEKVVSVKLGKFRSVDNGGGDGGEGSSDSNADARRCFSMGSFAYVMDEGSSLQVPIRTPMKKQSSKKPCLPLTPGHRPAMSECGCDSRREFNGFEAFKILDIESGGIGKSHGSDYCKSTDGSKRESFSVSKIWLRGRKDKQESSRRAFSFRFPVHKNAVDSGESKEKDGPRTSSEIDLSRWEDCGSGELGGDEEIQSCNSLDSQVNAPSFAKRTLRWFLRRPNKVVNSSFSGNV